MPRPIRLVVPGEPHHVTHKGNDRNTIFFDSSCFYLYLRLLGKRMSKYDISLLAFCLMPNHIHLILKPPDKTSLAQAMCELARNYTGYVNDKYRRTGHLWERRYYSCPLEPNRLWRAVRYVERNPVRAGLVDKPWNYPWSSSLQHTNRTQKSAWHQCQALIELEPLQEPWDPNYWRRFVAGNDSSSDMLELRKRTRTGKPWGSEGYTKILQTRYSKLLKAWTVD